MDTLKPCSHDKHCLCTAPFEPWDRAPGLVSEGLASRIRCSGADHGASVTRGVPESGRLVHTRSISTYDVCMYVPVNCLAWDFVSEAAITWATYFWRPDPTFSQLRSTWNVGQRWVDFRSWIYLTWPDCFTGHFPDLRSHCCSSLPSINSHSPTTGTSAKPLPAHSTTGPPINKLLRRSRGTSSRHCCCYHQELQTYLSKNHGSIIETVAVSL